jgi:predicted nuclease of predicted toxin-antitoxin system
MRIRFQADADLDGRLIKALKRKFPGIDFRTAAEGRLEGAGDQEVLRIAARDRRVLVSQDRRTMPAHFAAYTQSEDSSGVVLLRPAIPIAVAAEEIAIIWTASEPEEWVNRLVWIPL